MCSQRGEAVFRERKARIEPGQPLSSPRRRIKIGFLP
jgi:hypothetical protein